jgi:phage shock protein E
MKHLTTTAQMACLAAFGWFAGAGLAGEHTKDSLDTVKKNMTEKKAVLVDVREQQEWDNGHLRDAALLPLSDIPNRVADKLLEKQFAKGTILYLHCASGRRCLKAADLLSKTGYDVRPVREGYEALLKSGFPKAEK